MIIGMDLGASALKIVGVENGRVLFTHAENNHEKDISSLLEAVLIANGVITAQIEAVAITGVGAERFSLSGGYKKIVTVPEIEATGEGGTSLAEIAEAVVVSLGTGTSLVLAKNGNYTHIGGSGVGSGTVRGLSKKMLGITDLKEYFSIAETGNCANIDLQIRDLFSGTDTLPLDLTASNLAKCMDDATDADWAAAVINMVLEVAGSHAAIAASGFGVTNVIITGGLSQTKIAADCYAKFDKLYPQHFIIPEYSAFATAIGATRRV
ncbi:MAG: hypothetical protein EOM14_05040 [Clostridia bacterium]|nr:hypothetical protein [Clostridia bacterium]